MGLDTPSVKFLCAAKRLGVDFTTTAMIGRQVFFSNTTAVARVFSALGVEENADNFVRENNHSFAEPYFRLLGARSIISLDYSPYEAATNLHDMNLPIPDSLRERFTAVHDGGTLEHVFNAPQALKNCMEMLQIGGHFLQVSPANNYMGHGFWQFSPELVFRVFAPANGFRIRAVLLHEVVPDGKWYTVTDPDRTHSRVELCNAVQTYILTVAQRVAAAEIFATPPQQSDYVALWKASPEKPFEPGADPVRPSLLSQASVAAKQSLGHLPPRLKKALRAAWTPLPRRRARPTQGFVLPYYRQITEEQLLRGELS